MAKQHTAILNLSAANRKYIAALTVPGRQGDFKTNPVKRLVKFNPNTLPKKLFNSMDGVNIDTRQMSLKEVRAIPCISRQRDINAARKGKLLSYLLSKNVNLSTLSVINIAHILETGEYVVLDGNTRIHLCLDELQRELNEDKPRRFAIPEYFNVQIHQFKTQAEANEAYDTYDNANATEKMKEKLSGALYESGNTEWMTHPILRHQSYTSAMRNILVMNGNKNAKKHTPLELIEIFGTHLQHIYSTFDSALPGTAATRFIFAILGLRLVNQRNPKELKLIDQFLKEALAYEPQKQGLYGAVGEGMFHNEFVHVDMESMRYMRKESHPSTNIALSFGLVLDYYNGWKAGKEYTAPISTKRKCALETSAWTFFRGEDS